MRTLAWCVAFFLGGRALADEPAVSEADALFRAGKDQLASGHVSEACASFEQSYRVAPATGCLLALALCHEREGKLATAFREYEVVAARSHDEGRLDRERAARERASTLAARRSTLTIRLASELASLVQSAPSTLVISLDDALLGPSELGVALPVDGGVHRVEASAPGRSSFRAEVRVALSADTQLVTIRGLEPLTVAATTVPPSSAPAQAAPLTLTPFEPGAARAEATTHAASRAPQRALAPTAAPDDGGLSALQWVGIAGIGAGTAGIATSLWYGRDAVRAKHRALDECSGRACTVEGREARSDAHELANRATIAFTLGASLMAGGIVACALGGRTQSSRKERAKASLRGSAWATTQGLGAALGGSF